MPQRRASLLMRERYQLRLLSERARFYAATTDLKGLADRGLAAPTGRTDESGRSEWAITDAGWATLRAIDL